jgi:hypothetical protein
MNDFCRKLSIALATFVALLAITQSAPADDGGISFGGAPHLLKGHASVAMASEVVKMDIGDELIKVDCQFVFHNSGPACTVRVGFPDQGLGAEEPYQGEPVPKKNVHGTFLTYDSWVDGKKVPTKVAPAEDRSVFWHAKTVTFKAHGDTRIHDVYTLKPGAQMTNENGLYRQTYYVLHTGSSWHGPIGKADVIITFGKNTIKDPIELKPFGTLPDKDLQHMKWSALPAGTLIFEGPCAPKLNGRTITFSRNNFKPTDKDDVHLYWGFKFCTNMQ